MADLSDVLSLLAGKAAAAVYPNGTGQPSVADAPIKVYPGWPVPNVLDTDLAAGKVHISVYPLGTERVTSRHLGRNWSITQPPAPTLTATVAGESVTLGGKVSAPQNVYLLVDGQGYHHAVQSTDTLTGIAVALASQILGASSNGAVITIPGASSIEARVGGFGKAMRELRRQEKQFQITVWASDPTCRDAVASAVDVTMAIDSNLFFVDGSAGILRYSRTLQTDQLEKAKLYRRDLVYTVDFATTQAIDAPQVIAPVLNIADSQGQPIRTIQE